MSFADSKYGVVFVLDNKNLFNSRRFGMLEQKKHNVFLHYWRKQSDASLPDPWSWFNLFHL